MKPDERQELEQAAQRITKASRKRTVVLAATVLVVVVSVNVGATTFTLSRSANNREAFSRQLAVNTQESVAIAVAAELGLRCILRETEIPEQGAARQKVFDDCYREFDRLVKFNNQEGGAP